MLAAFLLVLIPSKSHSKIHVNCNFITGFCVFSGVMVAVAAIFLSWSDLKLVKTQAWSVMIILKTL
jgi:hypothetical protein